MGIPLKQGRFFTPQDDERSSRVVVIDEVFAHKYFGAEDPIGKRIRQESDEDPRQIVGVVGHVNQYGLDSDDRATIRAQFYFPLRAMPDNMMPRLAAAGVDVTARVMEWGQGFLILSAVSSKATTARTSSSRPQTMEEIIAGTLAVRRFSMTLLNAFAVVALLLSSIGLRRHSVSRRPANTRTRRPHRARGRTQGRLRLVVNHGMKMALWGVALGILAALGLTRLLTEMLYGVSATDPATFTVIALSLVRWRSRPASCPRGAPPRLIRWSRSDTNE